MQEDFLHYSYGKMIPNKVIKLNPDSTFLATNELHFKMQ